MKGGASNAVSLSFVIVPYCSSIHKVVGYTRGYRVVPRQGGHYVRSAQRSAQRLRDQGHRIVDEVWDIYLNTSGVLSVATKSICCVIGSM